MRRETQQAYLRADDLGMWALLVSKLDPDRYENHEAKQAIYAARAFGEQAKANGGYLHFRIVP